MNKLDKMITFAYFREECDLPENLPDKKLEYPIYRSQETLRMLMGDAFYQDYLTNYKADSFSSAYTSLFPYVKQFIAWQANEYYLQKANMNLTINGYRVHKEDNSDPASTEQMAFVFRDAKFQSQYYKKQLVDYMDNHYTEYPLYEVNCHNKQTGNGFKISVVKKTHPNPQPYGTNNRGV